MIDHNEKCGCYLLQEDNHIGLFFILLEYANDKNFKIIYDFICQNFELELPEFYYNINDYKYFLFWLLTCEKKYLKEDLCKMNLILINFLKTLVFINQHIMYRKKEYSIISKYMEATIEQIYHTKQLICWCDSHVKWCSHLLHYINLYDLKDIDYEPQDYFKSLDILQENDKIHIKKENKDIEIKKKVKKMPSSNYGLKRYKTIYKALSEGLLEFKKEKYCPWCNPDDLLKPSPKSRPRLNDDCVFIKNFILENLGGYNEKYLNNEITKIKEKDNLEDTIRKRGVKLLKYLELISNEQLEDIDIQRKYNKCVELIKSKYNV